PMAGIEIRGLTKAFRDGTRALEGVDLDVQGGELLVLVGPSGSGKTTLLRLVAGLDQPTAGSVRLGGKDLAGVPPHKRNVTLVFQNLALYSHLSVADNLAFGLNHERSNERISETAKLLGIDHLLSRFPAELSGGEQQRVALGRAIVRQPAVLLLDEPLSSLDAPVRRGLRRELRRLQQQLGVPTIYVTHDQAEALALGDRIAVLDRGRLQQVGTPNEIYHRPANRFVAEFFGPYGMNMIQGQLKHEGGQASFTASTLTIDLPLHTAILPKPGDVLCGFRPEDARCENGGPLRGKLTAVESLGPATYGYVQLPNHNEQIDKIALTIQLDPNTLPPKCGEEISFAIRTDRLHWFDPNTSNRLSKA
ncbi:MAG TPA: ABC transporter ATP-binding protein, partial [Pirellulaceae bacterium]|nr:ABC transporter ATP-binding protein [Pirellulaceae bacterium]